MTIAPSDAPPASYETRFTRLVGCRLPIQSAPMAGVVSDAELPAAVAAAGGHGMFPALFLSAPYLTRVISDLSGRTRAYGVNFIGLMLDRECLEIAAGHAPLVELFLAEPSREIVETIHAGGALASYQVASDQQALRAQDAGADLLVVQGIEAGGHPAGELGLLPLLEEVLAVATVPVVAAGGIGGPRAVAAVLAAGADAARAGTRFVAAAESRAHGRYKQALVEAGARDAVLTRAFSAGDPVGNHPARAAQRPAGGRGVPRRVGRRGRARRGARTRAALRLARPDRGIERRDRGDGAVRGPVGRGGDGHSPRGRDRHRARLPAGRDGSGGRASPGLILGAPWVRVSHGESGRRRRGQGAG